ncbi:hypothetical protein HPB52_007692 [Rhipicephalus sanguineus]|uniref:Uncharacterized protein n=1 Tax=Rhipicephalus sanguineus TaxID=34632 RepID=A0A9D4PIG8_RHISA|nr:hypothetical protein HPB52_007692 [Rhipicephalus sanguineus]
MGIRTNSTQMFPPDGLCEYLFYDSLYKEGRNTFDAPDQFDTNLRTFVEIAPTYKTTAFGIGLSYNAAPDLQSYLLEQVTKKFNVMQYFWNHSIHHIGVLDSATVDPREVDIKAALNCLKILRDDFSQEIISQGIKVFTFFAASIPNAAWARFYARNFKDLRMPDLYIALGHYSRGDNSLRTCVVVAPTQLRRPRGAEDSYQYDMTTAAESIVRLSGLKLKSALSVTLSGHLAVPTDPNNRGFLAPCMTNDSVDSFASYAELCTIKEEHTVTKFGIAVFDVDYADFSNVCKSRGGPFARLHLLRSVLNFFRTRAQAVTLRLLQTSTYPSPAALHTLHPERFPSPDCPVCGGYADSEHVLWGCASAGPPVTQGEMKRVIKTQDQTSQILAVQRARARAVRFNPMVPEWA